MPKRHVGLSETCLGREEEKAVLAVLRTGWLSQGEQVAALERAIAGGVGLHGVAVASCTAGLHLALAGLGLGPGDEVLVPGVTFVATVNAVLYAGARPVPVDIEPDLPHMSLEAAARAVTPRTRAVVIMHYGGYLMDPEAWRNFADRQGLLLIEDAAHCPGLPEVGRWSHAAVLSFFANKNMTTAEGGMILTGDAALAGQLRLLRGHAMTSSSLDRARGHASSYDVRALGWNYRMDELRAAVGLAQYEKLPASNARRRELCALYRAALARRAPWTAPPFTEAWPTAAHLMTVLLPARTDRPRLMEQLREAGIQSSVHYPMYHRFTWHKSYFGELSLPHTEDWCSRTLTLPLHPGLHDSDVEYVVAALETIHEADSL